ncbi:MAG TPA: radical SAM protein [Rhizomicrobium sp.]
MILNESIDVETQIKALIDTGWYQDARTCAELTLQHGLISNTAHDGFMRALAGKPATAHPGHQVYGPAIGFDSNTVFSSLQFTRLASEREMKAAFKQAVNKIEIETSTQCNRHCTYCPNSQPGFEHRRTRNEFMDMMLFRKMLEDLSEIDYDQKISLVGMNEFFMHEENFAYLELIKQVLPRCTIQIYSNGDYLTRAYLERAERAGVDLIVVSLHLQAGKAYNADDIADRAAKFSKRANLLLHMTDYQKGRRFHFQTQLGRLNILAGLVNWETDGHSWGGIVDAGKEMAATGTPCQSPVNILCLTQDGDFTLCCAVPRERTPENLAHGAVLGNLRDFPSIFHAYASDAMLYWRQHAFSTQKIPPLCQDCSWRNSHANSLNRQLGAFVEQQHGYIAQPNAADATALPVRAAACG